MTWLIIYLFVTCPVVRDLHINVSCKYQADEDITDEIVRIMKDVEAHRQGKEDENYYCTYDDNEIPDAIEYIAHRPI